MLLSFYYLRIAVQTDRIHYKTLTINTLQNLLIFGVFATKRGAITKYAKYEEVTCQENSQLKPI